MTPAERRKLKEDRAKLTRYRNRLMLLKDVVPNINALWQDNSKIVKFFESGEAAKFESRLTIKPGKPMDKPREPLKVVTDLTPEIFRELKKNGTSDKLIREQYKMHTNQLIAWKKANGVDNLNLPNGIFQRKKHKEYMEKVASDVVKAAVEIKEVDANTVRKIEQDYKERITTLNLKNKQLEKSLVDSGENIAELEETAETALKAQKQALEELSEFQIEYRKLEVDYRNQSSELTRVKAMLEKLKRTEQINVWLMEQHIGFVAQLDEVAR